MLQLLLQGSAHLAILAGVAGQLLEQRVDMPSHRRQGVARPGMPDGAGRLPQARHALSDWAEILGEGLGGRRGGGFGRAQPSRRQQRPGAEPGKAANGDRRRGSEAKADKGAEQAGGAKGRRHELALTPQQVARDRPAHGQL